jgi:hypothetical protein
LAIHPLIIMTVWKFRQALKVLTGDC